MPLRANAVVAVRYVDATVFHLVGKGAKAATVFQLNLKCLCRVQGCRRVDDIKISTRFIGVARHLQTFVISHGSQIELFATLRHDERNIFNDALALIIHSVQRPALGHHQGLGQTPVRSQ